MVTDCTSSSTPECHCFTLVITLVITLFFFRLVMCKVFLFSILVVKKFEFLDASGTFHIWHFILLTHQLSRHPKQKLCSHGGKDLSFCGESKQMVHSPWSWFKIMIISRTNILKWIFRLSTIRITYIMVICPPSVVWSSGWSSWLIFDRHPSSRWTRWSVGWFTYKETWFMWLVYPIP